MKVRLCASPYRDHHRADNDLIVPETSCPRWEAAPAWHKARCRQRAPQAAQSHEFKPQLYSSLAV